MYSSDVVSRIIGFNSKLSELGYNFKFRLVIVGGSAMLLHYGDIRSTLDIDSATKLKNLSDIAKMFDINDSAASVIDFPPNYETRVIHFNSFSHLDVFLLHPIDLFLIKLQRLSEKDSEDISIILDNLDNNSIELLIDLGDYMSQYSGFVFKDNWLYYRSILCQRH